MQTVCLLNSVTQLGFYDLAALRQEHGLRFIAILPEEQADAIPAAVAEQLDAVYLGQTVPQDGIPTMPLQSLPPDCLTDLARLAAAGTLTIASTTNEYAPLAAALRSRFGLPGRSLQNIEPYWNKARAKAALQQAGLRTPRGVTVSARDLESDPQSAYHRLTSLLGDRFILKPHEAAGCVGATVIDGAVAFKDWIGADKVTDRFEAEEYLTGTLYHCDSIVQDGRIWQTFCWEYTFPNLFFLSGKPLGSITLTEDTPRRQRLMDFSARALQALGMVDGSSHMEVFWTEADEPVFLEIGPRPPGSMIYDCFETCYGQKLPHLDLLVSLGMPLPPPPPIRTSGYWVVWPQIAGRVEGYTPPDLDCATAFQPLFEPGEVISGSIDIRYQSGRMHSYDPDFARLYKDFDKLRRMDNPLRVTATG